jgi:coenzyme F420-0:L-glutamate ligase/coenzyme F420-1:gamma-L-glutamate ligase
LIQIIGLRLPLVRRRADLAGLIAEASRRQRTHITKGDILVIAQKIVSKAEGRIVDLKRVRPSELAIAIAKRAKKDPRQVEVVLRETKRIVRMEEGHLIVETKHGLVCANAGVDKSNVRGRNLVTVLPKNPDRSADRIRRSLERKTGSKIAVIISDTFGRPWRLGHVNFAIGVSGMRPIVDYRGKRDMFGYQLTVTQMAVADELAAAAELAMNKADRMPVALIRGYRHTMGRGWARNLIRPREQDLFR